jgi:hypothetical protein
MSVYRAQPRFEARSPKYETVVPTNTTGRSVNTIETSDSLTYCERGLSDM